MNSNTLKNYGLVIFLMISVSFSSLMISCDKKDAKLQLELLQSREWEQLSTVVIDDSVNILVKYFHKVNFNPDGSYDILIHWGAGGVPNPDTIVLTPLHGDCEYDEEQERILFPGIVDSMMMSIAGGDMELFYCYFTPWKILQLNDTLMIVETEKTFVPPVPPVHPAMVYFPGNRFQFRAIDN